jgi:hypothetical protein
VNNFATPIGAVQIGLRYAASLCRAAPLSSAAPFSAIMIIGAFVFGRLQKLVHYQQPTPVVWPFPQTEHKAFFEQVPEDDFQFIPRRQGARTVTLKTPPDRPLRFWIVGAAKPILVATRRNGSRRP